MAQDVVDLLMDDHREVERLLELMKEQPDQRALVLPVVTALLTAHARAEEAEVYPVARKEAGEAQEVAHSRDEHQEAEQLLQQLQGLSDPSSKKFDELLQKLVTGIQHHVEEEEDRVLPGMREQLGTQRRRQLGDAFITRRAAELAPAKKSGGASGDKSKGELYDQAKEAGVPGRSSMDKDELAKHLE